MTDVVVVVPVLDRPHRVPAVIDSFTTATDPAVARLLFVVGAGDRRELAALDECHADRVVVNVVSYPAKVNAAYAATSEPWLFLAADDVHFHPGWLDAALDAATGDGVGVVGTNDLGNSRVLAGQHSTHSLVARSYCDDPGGTVDRPGTVLHDGYRHWYCDDELVQVAQARGRYRHAPRAVVEHLHPYHGKARRDGTYRLGESRRRQDRRVYEQRMALWT